MLKPWMLIGSSALVASCNLYDEQLLSTRDLLSPPRQVTDEGPGALPDDFAPGAPLTMRDAGLGEAGASGSAAHSGSEQEFVDSGHYAEPSSDAGTAGDSAAAGNHAAGSGGDAAQPQAGSAAEVAGAGGEPAAGSGGTGQAGSADQAGAGSGGAGAGGAGGASGAGAAGTGADPECELGGQTWSGNGHCYFPTTTQATWNVSRDNCNQKGAKLVSITSAAELNFVGTLMGSTPTWIGLSKFGAPQFSWATSEPLNYTNWAAGEPNLSGEAAVAMRSDTLLWFDDAVGATRAAICERP